MDSALRENLSAGLADGLDDAILSGTNGLFTGTNLPNNAQTTNDTFDSYLSNLIWNQIDGRYAAMTSDLAMVVGAVTYKDLGQTYRNTSVDRSALDRIMELVSGVRVSAHVPAPSSNRQNVVIRRGMSTTAVAPLWEGCDHHSRRCDQGGQRSDCDYGGDAVRHESLTDGWRPGEARHGPLLNAGAKHGNP